jgi:hypothetical protein
MLKKEKIHQQTEIKFPILMDSKLKAMKLKINK